MATRAYGIASLAAIAGLFGVAKGQSDCNPTKTTCPAQPGLTSSLSVDFTKYTSLPPGWTLAGYESVNYGANGAEFSFNKPPDSPYIWTSDYFLFGHVEVVLQAAKGTGIISSIVLLSDALDEVDWEFSGNNFGATAGKVQTNYFGKGITGSYDRGTQPPVDSPQTEFHTYGFDWSAESLTWSIDGTVVRTLLASAADTADHQYPQTPMQLHLGLWDAGAANNSAGTVEWAGGYTDISQAPFTMYVKSVTVNPTNLCASYAYGDMSGSYGSIKCGSNSVFASASSGAPTGLLPASTTAPPVVATGGPSNAQQNETITVDTCTTSTPVPSTEPEASTAPTAVTPTPAPECSTCVDTGPSSASSEYPSSATPTPAASNSASPSEAPITPIIDTPIESPFPDLLTSTDTATDSSAPPNSPAPTSTDTTLPASGSESAATAPAATITSTPSVISTYTPGPNAAAGLNVPWMFGLAVAGFKVVELY